MSVLLDVLKLLYLTVCYAHAYVI
uniref:Uncharacterized protein n=1 Tax=Anguilla anguilla TaxID=7936 RepID=A0A0E9V147_ANGAN